MLILGLLVKIRLGRPPHGGRGLKLHRTRYRIRAPVCRPPHGGRGLKYKCKLATPDEGAVAPRTGGVD